MGKRVEQWRWERFFHLLKREFTQEAAANDAGISMSTVERLFHDPGKRRSFDPGSYRLWLDYNSSRAPSNLTRKQAYDPDAQAALDDFGLFRRRYFGRVSVPWQNELGHDTVGWVNSPADDFVVWNVAPGAGKTTVLRDLVCWLLSKDRSLRIMWGSRVYDQAAANVNKIRDEFTRSDPIKASTRELQFGRAIDAEATLSGDFGRFKPDKDETEFWTRNKFTVVQKTGTPTKDKEASLTAYGFDGGYLGGRFDVCIWDDVDDMRSIKASVEVRENLLEQWGQIVENRLEPGGLFLLVGQRLSAHDLYRYCLDQTNDDGRPIYQHFVRRAHDEEKCVGEHGDDAKAWPEGCLLDPVRLPWSKLKNKAGQRRARYRVTYQQEDVDPDSVLIPQLWIDGGTDPETREDFPGCWDDYRLGESPKDLPPGVRSLVTIDPSGSKFWAVEGWLIHPKTEQSWLVGFFRDPLSMDELLSMQVYTAEFSGVVEDMWQSMNRIGRRPTHLVAEHNAAQRHIFINNVWTQWRRARGVTAMGHTTGKWNKADPDLGLDTLRDPFKYGRIHLPAKSKAEIKVFTDEHTNHPAWMTDDTVMANWFRELNYRRLFPLIPEKTPAMRRPSWIKGKNRYVAA